MKRIISIILSALFLVSLTGCNDTTSHEGEAKTPSGSSVQQGRNYQDVVKEFEENGFTNIKTETIDDLITGWLTKEGEVESVSVDGDVDYSPDDWYPNDTEVVITYHTFSKDSDIENPNFTPAPTETLEPVVSDVPITINNSEEFTALLQLKDEFDPSIQAFSDTYFGKTIEFDGNIAYVNPHDNYSTRFDYLILAGDYSETNVSGPNFRFTDVNYSDLHLTGDNIPDEIGIGLNVHIIATVGSYDESTGLFEIVPTSISIR